MNNEKIKNCTQLGFMIVFTIVIHYLIKDSFLNITQQTIFNKSHCNLWEYFIIFEYDRKYFIVFILLYYTNTYVVLIYLLMDSFSLVINGTAKLLFYEPRPFMEDITITPCICAVNLGTPSTNSLSQFILFVFTAKAILEFYSKLEKSIVYSASSFLLSLSCMARLMQNAHSLDQVLMGLAFGYFTYYLFFTIIYLDLTSKKEFSQLTSKPLLLIAFPAIFIIFYYIYTKFLYHEFNQTWLGRIESYCPIIENNVLDNESYQKLSSLFTVFGFMSCLYLEKHYLHPYIYKDLSFLNKNMKRSFYSENFYGNLTYSIFSFFIFFTLNGVFKFNVKPFFSNLLYNFILKGFFKGFILNSIKLFIFYLEEIDQVIEDKEKSSNLIVVDKLNNK